MAGDPAGISADAQVARIFEWRRGFNTIHLIDVGIRTGLFKAFAEAPDSPASRIAQKLGLNAHCVDVWCKTAFGMELLDAVDGSDGVRYRLAPHLDSILAAPGHPRYLGGYVRLGTDVAAEDFRRCVTAFASGEVKPFQGRGDAFNQAIAESTWGLQVVTAKKILPGLEGLAARLDGGTVLEVGCGTGNFLLQAAKAFPQARVLGVDIEADSLASARSRIAQAGLGARVEVRQGTVADTAQPGSVDAIVMIEVLHEIGQGIRPQVLRECGAALQPGGWLVIVDETYPTTLEEMRRPEFKFPLMTGFEELLWGNVIPTREEQERLLRDAGLTGAIHRSLIGEGFTVLATRKP
jgi:2-polyprenyl-3-methyl-5-hydroxy-6-metoxy-1,4-benzoquinol methylase